MRWPSSASSKPGARASTVSTVLYFSDIHIEIREKAGRLGWTHPDMARFITGSGLSLLDEPTGLAPRALRDIRAGQAVGCFAAVDADVALCAVAGGLLGLLRLCQDHPERMSEQAVDRLAEAILRLLGVPAAEAARLAALPLPEPGNW